MNKIFVPFAEILMAQIVQMKEKIRVGITHGDFNGINYEIIMKALSDTAINEFFIPVVYGSSKAAAYYRKALGMENFNFNVINGVSEANVKRANIINVTDNVKVEMGLPSQLAEMSSIRALDMAVGDLQAGKIDVIVTCPVNKSDIYSSLKNFSGHTKYFANKFGVKDYMMLMVNELMRIGFVTDHIPFGEILKSLTKDLIINKISLLNESLKNDFMILSPRIAVLSLNPHGGNNGSLGKEEVEIICPAVEDARKDGILVFGAYSSDEFFASGNFSNFDAVLAMYYDQGMIPFKSIGLSRGVEYSVGLPIVQTSPTHGTEYDIVGKNVAMPMSLRDALFLAVEIYGNRKAQDEIGANPLKIRVNHQKKALE
ncbi:MAG: 4-hydroxythreonine-4-phosphate dehydrogenase PdxA [Prevotellaceae bacterium]|jgi:4-hydroxythreonine-4-phosphate dehydrogenase|nr:4-hydroxythreonine-4-phosphate dehydrogenase PdxA [Prevotellaceae bacterium]